MLELNQKIIHRALSNRRVKPKMGALPYPKAIERAYYKEIENIVKQIAIEIKEKIVPMLEMAAKDFQGSIKKDSGADDVVKAISEIKSRLFTTYSDYEIKRIAQKKGISLAQMNKEILEKKFKRVVGVDIFTNDRALTIAVDLFSIQNTELIKSMMDATLAKTQTTVLSGFQNGLRWEEISKEIIKNTDPRIGISANKAKLIARDQISKLNGQVTQIRQQDLGINKYIWRTSGDERVRDSHAELEGETFSWDDPPSVGHPGDDFQCRCTAEPVLDEFFEE